MRRRIPQRREQRVVVIGVLALGLIWGAKAVHSWLSWNQRARGAAINARQELASQIRRIQLTPQVLDSAEERMERFRALSQRLLTAGDQKAAEAALHAALRDKASVASISINSLLVSSTLQGTLIHATARLTGRTDVVGLTRMLSSLHKDAFSVKLVRIRADNVASDRNYPEVLYVEMTIAALALAAHPDRGLLDD